MGYRLSVLVLGLANIAVELNLHLLFSTALQRLGLVKVWAITYVDCDVVSWELPGVEVKPVVGNLDLVAIDNLLLENTITIS